MKHGFGPAITRPGDLLVPHTQMIASIGPLVSAFAPSALAPLARSLPRMPVAARVPFSVAPQMVLELDPTSALDQVGSTVAFADQAGKLAGTFFMASLLPYIGFLYFLGYEKNNCPKQAYFGFQFLLLFVLSTVCAPEANALPWCRLGTLIAISPLLG